MSRPRWYAERGAITATVETGGEAHHVTWRKGQLILHDHNVTAEEVLQALGGEPCPCLLLRDALRGLGGSPGSVAPAGGWQYQRTVSASLRLGVSGSVRTTRSISVPIRPGGQASDAQQLVRRLQSDPNFLRLPVEQRTRTLGRLRLQVARQSAPEGMREIITLAERVRAARLGRQAEARPEKRVVEEVLQAAAVPAVEDAMRQAQGYLRPQAVLTVGCWKHTPGEERILQGDMTSRGGFVTLSLPVHWLNRVWRRGLACVDGHFVLDVDAPAPASDLSGEAVRWQRRLGGHAVPVAAPCRIRRRAGRWQLAW